MQQNSPKKGIQSRLIRVFTVQAALVSLATALGVFAAYKIVEDVLVKEALDSEAQHYLKLVEENGDFPLPNTQNMRGFRASLNNLQSLPAELQSIKPGFGRHSFEGAEPLILVTEQNGERLYLLFKEEQVSRLAIFFGVAPLTVVLIIIYLASWFTFRQSQRVISPVVQLAKAVENVQVTDSEALSKATAPFHSIDSDIDTLATAIEHFAFRQQNFVERERSFTRDASHELRTPLAVLKGSVDVLEQMETLSEKGDTVLSRMRQTVSEMESLITTLLLLAREEITQLSVEDIHLNNFVPPLINSLQSALSITPNQIVIRNFADLQLQAPSKVLTILLSNLIKNAIIHGQGSQVVIAIDQSSISITDQGPGMDAEVIEKAFQPFYRGSHNNQGHGLGLSIVKRLCDRFHWQISVSSHEGKGTKVRISFDS